MNTVTSKSSRSETPDKTASPLTPEMLDICQSYLRSALEEGVIVLISGPAAGKGTNGKILSEYLGIPIISTGSLLRERSEIPDKLGRSLKRTLKRGGLVSDDVVFDLLEKHLTKIGSPRTFIIDGLPRAMSQIDPLRELLARRGITNLSALYLKCSLDTALSRSADRRAKDIAAGEKPRNDDKPDTVRKRYADFENDTLSCTRAYARLGALAEADVNSGSREVNFRRVAKALSAVVSRWTNPYFDDLRLPDRRRFIGA